MFCKRLRIQRHLAVRAARRSTACRGEFVPHFSNGGSWMAMAPSVRLVAEWRASAAGGLKA